MKRDKKIEQQSFPFIFFDIGWRISIPLVLVAVAGSILDNHFHTKPLFILVGLGLSLVTTSWAIYRLVKRQLPGKN